MCWWRWTPPPHRTRRRPIVPIWAPLHHVGRGRRVPLPAGTGAGGRALPDASGRRNDRGEEVAVHPVHDDPVGVLDQPVPHRRRTGRPRPWRGGSPSPVRRAPPRLDDIRILLAPLELVSGSWPAGAAARRDMAILLMGFAGAHRRGELVALTLADVT